MKQLATAFLMGISTAGAHGVSTELTTPEQNLVWWWLFIKLTTLSFVFLHILNNPVEKTNA